jgi:hypothetical protein
MVVTYLDCIIQNHGDNKLRKWLSGPVMKDPSFKFYVCVSQWHSCIEAEMYLVSESEVEFELLRQLHSDSKKPDGIETPLMVTH